MGQSNIVEAELKRIIIDETRPEQLVVLKEKNGDRVLPIFIGSIEAASIKMEISGIQPIRPQTHDLFGELLRSLNVRLEKIVIDALENNTFFAKLYIANGNAAPVVIDARPSDSIAIALRTKSPIFIEQEVLDKVGLKEEDSEEK